MPQQSTGPVDPDYHGQTAPEPSLPKARVFSDYATQLSAMGINGGLVSVPGHVWNKMPATQKRFLHSFTSLHISGGDNLLLPEVTDIDCPELRKLIPFQAPRQGNCKSTKSS